MSVKSVRIRIVTKIDTGSFDADARIDEVSRYTADVSSAVITDCADATLPLMTSISDDTDGPTMTEVKGTLTRENGDISLNFATHLTGVFPSLVTYKFKENNTSNLAVIRKSMGERVYYFSNECKRQTVVCDTDGASFEIAIYTKKLKNHLTYENGGFIEIEYYAEVRAGVVEHCKEYILCEPD